MSKKGSNLSQEATSACEQIVQALEPMGEMSSRKMFGGYGIFESSAMFALVNSQGEVYLKVNDSNRARFEQAGAKQHGKMPYFQVPPEVLEDVPSLRNWAKVSIEIAHAAKKK